MSRPYFAFGQQLITRANQTNVQRLTDLGHGTIGVLTGTGSYRLAMAQPGLQVKSYDDNVNYFRDLEMGRLDAVLTDTPIARVNLAGNTKLRAAGEPFELGYYAVGVRPHDPILLGRINDAIEALLRAGTLESIYRKYGLWDASQGTLATWQPPAETALRGSRSALREWRTYLPILLRAAVTTVWVTTLGMTFAVCWGAALALIRQYGPPPLRWSAIAYIEIFRGTPLLLQLYFIYFGLAQQFGWNLSAGTAAVLALGLNYAATEAENYRAGLEAVPRGQTEAALALGMSRGLAIRRVILPQAVRISLPSVTNDFIAMFKDSSIVSVIGLLELTKEYQIRGLDSGDYIGVGLMTASIYFILSYAASLGVGALERKLR
jgi:polar amino acid transport system substrate-binding protein